jgi:hypothetical protein
VYAWCVPPPERTVDIVENAVENLRQQLRDEITGVPSYGTSLPSLLNVGIEHEVIRRQLSEALQIRIPGIDLNPGSNSRRLVETLSAQLMLETSQFQQNLRYAMLPQAASIPIEDIGEHGGMAVAASMSYAHAVQPLSPEMIYQAARTIDRQDRVGPDQFRAEYQGTFAQRAAADARDRILEFEDRQIMETLEMQEVVRNSWGEEWGARRVTVPMFDLASNPTIHLDEIRNRRFDLMSEPLPPILQFLLEWQGRKREASIARLPVRGSPKGTPKTAWEWILEDEAA